MNRVILARIALVIAGVLGLSVIGAFAGFVIYSANSSAAIRTTMEETGSSLEAPLVAEWATARSGIDKQVLVVPSASDSGTGIKDAENGLATIGASDKPAGNVKGLLSIPDTVGGVALVYNLPGVPSLNLNGAVLAGIYSGRITHWNDPAIAAINPNVNLPYLKITPEERSDSSGTTYQFTSYLQLESNSHGWPIPATTQNWPVGIPEQGSNAMVAGTAKTVGSIAYVGVSYEGVATTQYHLKVAAVADGQGKFLLPTRTNLAIALRQFAPQWPAVSSTMIGAYAGYPMANYEFFIVKQNQPKSQTATDVKQFLQWAVTDGSTPKYLASLNFLPLPSNVLKSAEAQIASIR